MKKIVLLLLLSLTCLFAKNSYKDADAPIEERVQDLLEKMTLEEKIGQMVQVPIIKLNESIKSQAEEAQLGSILGLKNDVLSVAERNEIQKIAVEKTRLGIPLIFGQDVVHGCETVFPLSLAQSCSWNPHLIEQAARVAAIEAAAKGIDWTFAPMVDVSRDPRWGRIAECYGEDSYLNSIFAAAFVKGVQGKDLSDPETIAACMKHFVGYGASLGGRDYQYTEISERALREVYLPPFHAGVQAGVQTFMSAFNDISGFPASANPLTLTEILRGEWGFDGFVVSDWNAVVQLIPHGIAADSIEAAQKSVAAGVDMEMTSACFAYLKDAVESGAFDIEKINLAVERILRVKFRLGLFENPYTDKKLEKTSYPKKENLELAKKAACETMVLLKNEKNVLPLTDLKNIAVVGPFADNQDLLGWWYSLGHHEDVVTVSDGMKKNSDKTITRKVEQSTEAIVLCVGEDSHLFGENNGTSDIRLPYGQDALIKSYQQYNLPLIVVIFNGRPLDLTNVMPHADAVLLAWHPGTQGGYAVADVLYGDYNPSGKLTTSFPKSTGQIPVYYNHRNSGRPNQDYYKFLDSEPLFPFGFGKSYTTFTYSGMTLSADKIKAGENLQVSVTVQNTGSMAGEEIVQLYIQDIAASVTQPIKNLKQFKKISLQANESKTVTFELSEKDLQILDKDFNWTIEPGTFNVWVGPNSAKGDMQTFRVL